MRRVKTQRARELRARQTAAEAQAWRLLRNRRCLGFKFRRQHVLHGFTADFYCAELGLVIELDGAVHDDPECQARDHWRDAVLEERGIRVIRIRNHDLSRERLITGIRAVAASLTRGMGSRAAVD